MKLKKVLAVTLVAAMTMSLAACGNTEKTTEDSTSDGAAAETESAAPQEEDADVADDTLSYANIVLGESYEDITTH